MANNTKGEKTLGKGAKMKRRRWLVITLSATGFGIIVWFTVAGPLDDYFRPIPPGWGHSSVPMGDTQLLVIHRIESDGNPCECQVLFVLPALVDDEVTGRGSSGGASSRGQYKPPLLSYEVRWHINEDSKQTARVSLSYDPLDQILTIDQKSSDVSGGNLFCVLLDEEWDVERIVQLDESMSEQAGLADFKRLLPNEPAVQALPE